MEQKLTSVPKSLQITGAIISLGTLGGYGLLNLFLIRLQKQEFLPNGTNYLITYFTRLVLALIFVFFIFTTDSASIFNFHWAVNKQLVLFILTITFFSFISGYTVSLYLLGRISWLPVTDLLPTLLAACFFACVEEIEFRSVMLSLFPYWMQRFALRERTSQILVITFIILYFGLLYHIRYFMRQQYYILFLVFLLGLITTLWVVFTKNIYASMYAHALFNFTVFLFIGGSITQL